MNNNVQIQPKEDIMTLAQVAAYLKLAERTVLRMVHRNSIPCVKVGSQWRFLRSKLDDWLLSQMQVMTQNDLARLVELDAGSIQISRLVAPEYVILDVEPGTKEEILARLVRPLADRGIVGDGDEFLQGLIRRERTVSTAIGNGVALPHLRDPKANPIAGPALIVGICPDGTDFGSPDSGKTYLFFILSTDSITVHLRLLSKLNAMLGRGNLIGELKTAKSADDVLSALIRADYDMSREKWRETT